MSVELAEAGNKFDRVNCVGRNRFARKRVETKRSGGIDEAVHQTSSLMHAMNALKNWVSNSHVNFKAASHLIPSPKRSDKRSEAPPKLTVAEQSG